MSESKNRAVAPVDIDALLQDTWLQAIGLRHGLKINEGEGRLLWERCVEDVARVQESLNAAGLDEVSRQHILYAQCALLDEVVKGRGVQDDACLQWYDIPLQGHFLGTMEAGDKLCERMREALRDPASNLAVLTCFHRVMLLGFLGEYSRPDDPERVKLINALSKRVKPFRYQQAELILAPSRTRRRFGGWLAAWPARIGLGVLLLGILWLGLDYWLDHILIALLPAGAMK